jgi:predicted DNA repair protein MutK
VLGDDLALNAQQVNGVSANRELPVIWAVAKGSLLNKFILIPIALLLNAFLPALVTPLLMAGGAFLCFEGAEKLLHKLLPGHHDAKPEHPALQLANLSDEQIKALEADKIKGAIKTDFILSAEIIVIALGVVQNADFWTQVTVLCSIGVLMTVGVYALVAGIIKLDDLGLYLTRRQGSAMQAFGRGILTLAPWLMKALSVVGTAAMFLVGGGILVHGLPWLHHASEAVQQQLGVAVGGNLFNAVAGLVAGAAIVAVVAAGKRVLGRG